MPPAATLSSMSMSWLAARFCDACLLHAWSAVAPRNSIRILAAFGIGEARAWFDLRTGQLVLADLERLISGPALPFASEGEIAADRIAVGSDVRRRHRPRFVEAQLIRSDDEQAFRCRWIAAAVGGGQAPAPLKRCGDCGGRRRQRPCRTRILVRLADCGRRGRIDVGKSGSLHRLLVDRISAAAGRDDQEQGTTNEWNAGHAPSTVSPHNLLQAAPSETRLNSCTRLGSGPGFRPSWRSSPW